MSTSQRWQDLLTRFYASPASRRRHWQESTADPNRIGHNRCPCLELQAFRSFDLEFQKRTIDRTKLDEALGAFSGPFSYTGEVPDWKRPALALWPAVRSKVLDWDALNEGSRTNVTLVIFAVATILDDVRIIRWAAGLSASLATEFAFVVDDNQNSKGHTRTNPPGIADDLLRRWRDKCRVVSKLASTLADGADSLADLSVYEDLRRHVKALEDLRDPMQSIINQRHFDQQVQNLIAAIDKLGDEFNATWLHSATEIIRKQWRLTYSVTDRIDPGKVLIDTKQSISNCRVAIAEWRSTVDEKRHLHEELVRIRKDIESNIQTQFDDDNRETALYQSLADVTRQIRRAKQNTLNATVPEGEDFDPSAGEPDVADFKSIDPTTDPQKPNTSSRLSELPDPSETEEVDDAQTQTTPRDSNEPELEIPSGSGPTGNTNDASAKSLDSPSSSQETNRVVEPIDPEDQTEDPLPRRASTSHDAELQVLWTSILDRPSISYHIARLLSEEGINHDKLPPACLVAATALAKYTQSGDENATSVLKEHIIRIDPADLARVDSETEHSLNLLLFSATLTPALVAPETGATALLKATKLPAALSAVYELGKAIANYGDGLGTSVRFNATLLNTVLGQETWLQDFAAVRARAKDWLSKADKQRLKYGSAQRVWIRMLHKSECLGSLARLVAEADPSQSETVDSLRMRVDKEHDFAEIVRKVYRETHGSRRFSIGGQPLQQLRKHARPLLDLTTSWLRLAAVKSHSSSFVERSILSLRQSVRSLGQKAVDEIDDVTRSTESLQFNVSLAMAKQAVNSLQELFSDGITPERPFVANPEVILSRDLLFVPRLILDSHCGPTEKGLDLLRMLTSVRDHSSTMRVAFDTRLRNGDIVGASLACQEIELTGDTEVHEVRAALDHAVRQSRIELNKACNAHREALEQSLRFGQIDEVTAESLRSQIVSVDSEIADPEGGFDAVSIDEAQASIKKIGQFIEECRRKGASKVQSRFESIFGDCDPDARARIEQSISDGDLMAANELMSRIEDGDPLDVQDQEVEGDPFRDFMSVVKEIDGFAADPANSPSGIIDSVLSGCGFASTYSSYMSKVEVEEAAKLLAAWYELSVTRQFGERPFRDLLRVLGLPPRRVAAAETGPDYSVVTLETDLIEDRSRCPVPEFGSEARGRYRILLNWAKFARESISRHIDNRKHDATIVLHFGPLGKDRIWLRDWAVAHHRLFVVVDESLVLFLAGRSSGRLSALFRCVLPFSVARPYMTTSGLVPPELFFGRARERHRIIDRNGPCFIYGGRQLGKTALLRSVERVFHQPDRQQFAKWIDLKVREIGHPRPAAAIWPLLWRELRDLGVVQRQDKEPNPHIPSHVDKMIQGIERWTRDGDQRRLLLLLDEADNFLIDDADGDYRESTRLKGMMEQTDRRVKVVFAGLHNVLRITERANHPLAHLGEPINIGPLLTNSEWFEAQKLVKDPLLSVGFQFEPEDLSTRILAQTNYYPSLIQLYGAELVEHLRESGTSVPCGITDRDIGTVYRRGGTLRKAIRERFHLTLQLDPRYEVIAYALAFELLGKDRDLGHGIEGRELSEYARDWWPEGFDHDDREFNVLLQEMEGLGVLRSVVETSRYTLRNPNVLLLLGSRDEISRVLDKPREKPKRFDKSSFHARFSEKDSTLFCPLTYEQESKLRKGGGVAVVTGCSAAGIKDLKRFLSKRIEQTSFHDYSDSLTVEDFRRRLGNLRPRPPNLTTVVLIAQHGPWNIGCSEWLLAAQDALRRKTKTRDRIKVVFVADAELLWTLMKEIEDRRVELPEWIGVKPWDEIFLRHWLSDKNHPHDGAHVQQLMEISGGWPEVLSIFLSLRPRAKTWDARIEALNRRLVKTEKWLNKFGLTPIAKQQLCALVEHLPISSDSNNDLDTAAEMERVDADELRLRVEWGRRLGLLVDSDGLWECNPLIKRILLAGRNQ